MKLLRHGAPGAERPGLLDAEGRIRSLEGHVADIGPEALSPETLRRLASLDPATLPEVAAGTRLGPCVGGIGKLIGIGLNYSDHAEESGLPVPSEPIVFLKATSSISGPHDDVCIPADAMKTDWEVELAFVIGTKAKRVSEAEAMDHVAGYLICNDVSERAWQAERQGQWTKGKSHDTFAPLGPWMVTRDEIADPQDLGMRLWVNGIARQNGSTRTMIFGVAHLVSYLSHFMTLHPGDVITTGTPPGVGLGMKPQLYLKPGDVMRLEIDGLGQQEQRVVPDHD
ncbi:fumarylacetoacetate hydrolase family protein [Cereibacter changlensis]|uniref:Fumarylacetoacetate hydrolase family protein n=1 Tax=Cereibacter changlensis TaxID=402884 RepID=A0A4V5NLU8_9RHOB|nr:fumarylacetoacetate hydrolase family protein [Cereibacter changlensis]TKA97067.1 fumarylacetoacetate hydrolase family protein [Cereibacter changlensis]